MVRAKRIVLRPGLVVGVAVLLPIPALAGLLQQQQQQQARPGWPCAGKVDPIYVRTSEATGGKLMLFTPGELTGAAEEITASNQHPQTIFRASDQFDDEAREYTVPVDSTVESVYFFVSLQCLQSAAILKPNGEEVRGDAPGVESHTFQAIRLVIVKEPTPGPWTVRAAGRGIFTLSASGKSSLGLHFAIVENGKRTSGLPVAGKLQRLEAEVSGVVREVSFQFVSPNGRVKQALQLEPEAGSIELTKYAGELTPPNGDYRLSATGTDANGFRFQRVIGPYFVVAR